MKTAFSSLFAFVSQKLVADESFAFIFISFLLCKNSMFERYRTTGFVIKKENRGEADQLLTIYTNDFGKLVILGKAIRKISSKLRSAADIFCLSQIEFIQGKAHKTLTDAVVLDKFSNLKDDFKILTMAYKMAEVLDSLVKGQERDKKIWQLLNECFAALNNWKAGIVYHYFFWNLVSYLGYEPELFNCASCKKKLLPDKLYFDPKEGGVVCEKGGLEITPNVVKILRLILKRERGILARLKIENSDQKLLKVISSAELDCINPIK